MVGSKEKTVAWVVGSGFSRSLGGPLLADLFRKEDELAARDLLTGEANTIYRLFEQCTSRRYVDHAEQFLEFLDTAVKNPTRARMLERFQKGADMATIRDHAIKVVAAECDFLLDADTTEEGWQPYKHWAENVMGKSHYVITFNYDLVLETLGWHALMPDAQTHLAPRRTLKLHGSIDWIRTGTGIRQVSPEQMRTWKTAPLIAAPGPSKLKHSTDETLLRNLWGHAVTILKQASVIVFLGYRFPPSDSQARSVLLAAIRENDQNVVRVHTVLGPRPGDDDTVRLVKLLEHTLRGKGRITPKENRSPKPGHIPPAYEILPHPLYVEDFLTVIHDDELYGPY